MENAKGGQFIRNGSEGLGDDRVARDPNIKQICLPFPSPFSFGFSRAISLRLPDF